MSINRKAHFANLRKQGNPIVALLFHEKGLNFGRTDFTCLATLFSAIGIVIPEIVHFSRYDFCFTL